jgi:hypothetical protein
METKPRRSCAVFHEPAKFADSPEKVRHEWKYQPSVLSRKSGKEIIFLLDWNELQTSCDIAFGN